MALIIIIFKYFTLRKFDREILATMVSIFLTFRTLGRVTCKYDVYDSTLRPLLCGLRSGFSIKKPSKFLIGYI